MKLKHCMLVVIAMNLTACSGYDLGFFGPDENPNNYYHTKQADYVPDESINGYASGSEGAGPGVDPPPSHKFVPPPPSYHFATSDSPPRQDSVDGEWIQKQNQTAYTIQLPDDTDPSRVAATLQELPKTGHTTQYRYQDGGQTKYSGTLGSYPSKAAAEAAMQSLPDNVRGSAHVTQWQEIKSKVGQPTSSSITLPTTEADRPTRE